MNGLDENWHNYMLNDAIKYLSNYQQTSLGPFNINSNVEPYKNENFQQLSYSGGYVRPEYTKSQKYPKSQLNQLEIILQPPVPSLGQSNVRKVTEQFKPIAYPEINKILDSQIEILEASDSINSQFNLQTHEPNQNNNKLQEKANNQKPTLTQFIYDSPKKNSVDQSYNRFGEKQTIHIPVLSGYQAPSNREQSMPVQTSYDQSAAVQVLPPETNPYGSFGKQIPIVSSMSIPQSQVKKQNNYQLPVVVKNQKPTTKQFQFAWK